MAVTLRDVAERAGVSVRTVSNVVNDFAHVSDSTRQRVQLAINEMGYRPNIAARQLRGGRSGVLSYVVPELDNPYFAEVAREVISYSQSRGYVALIDQINGDRDSERRFLELGGRPIQVDGLIVSPQNVTADDLAAAGARVPIVAFEMPLPGSSPITYDRVGIDNVQAARTAVEHLIAGGRERIVILGVPDWNTQGVAGSQLCRLEGYRLALSEAGITADPGLEVVASRLRRHEGRAAIAALIESGLNFDAIFALSDTLAFGAMKTLREHGMTVSQDVAIVGFDNLEEGQFTAPTLTTIARDKAQLAALAVDRLLARIDGLDSAPSKLIADHRLIIRESST